MCACCVTSQPFIVDTVKYSNLVPGKTYTIGGELMNKDTGERLLDKNGNPVHATRTFVAGETGDGLVVTEYDEKDTLTLILNIRMCCHLHAIME